MRVGKINQFGLTERDMKTIGDILRKYPDVRTVHIFGSRAKGNYKTGSDIDLAIINEGVPENVIRNIQNDFEESSLPYRIDLIYLPELEDTGLKDHIKRIGLEFYLG
jgi:predicted nucleotidyltransferase